jgi:hypothetical protein
MRPIFKFKIPMEIILDMDVWIFAPIHGGASHWANA